MVLFRNLAHIVKLGASAPVNGKCSNDPNTYYAGCTDNGSLSYYCTGGGGFHDPDAACKDQFATRSCHLLPGGEVHTCSGVDPSPPQPPTPVNDTTMYCDCRKQFCDDDNDCAPSMKPQQQTALKKCCQGNQDCLNYAENDIAGFHTNPCGAGPPPIGGCKSSVDCPAGQTCTQHKCTPSSDYCDQKPDHDDWTDKDKQCLYKDLTTGSDALSPDVGHCIVKNISERYTLRQSLDLDNSDGDALTITTKCIENPNFDGSYSKSTGTPCSGDSECPSGQKCKDGKCKKTVLSVGAWVGIGLAILLVLGLIGFIVYRKRTTHTSDSSHLTRASI